MRSRRLFIITVMTGALAFAGRMTAASAAPHTVTVVIQQIAYSPTETKATVGDTIEWINKDVVAHTATAKSGAWKVVIPAGKRATLVLKRAGTFPYYCEFHPNMTARLVVAPRHGK